MLGYPIKYLPIRLQRYNLLLCLLLRYLSAVWFTNIQPMRAVLREKPEYRGSKGVIRSLFPYVPKKLSIKVAVLMGERMSFSHLAPCVPLGSNVKHMLDFPPLLKIFGDFCQKALCAEVRARRNCSLHKSFSAS